MEDITSKKYLSFFNKFGYGTGDFAANMVYALVSSFVTIYLTNTVGLNAGIIGSLILASKVLDGFTDIIFGTFIDRTHSKMGKARPWMLYSYIGNAITLILLFAIPAGISSSAQYVYFFITYTLLNAVFYTANNISYSALTSLITRNPQERVEMGTFRFIGATLGNLLVSNLALVFVERFGGGAAGWRMTAIIFAVIGLAVNTFSVFSVHELPEDTAAIEKAKKDHANFFKTLKALVSNKYFDELTMLYLLFYLMMGVSMGTAVYYFLYICGDANWFGKMVSVSSVAMVAGLILAPFLVKKFKSIRKVNLIMFSLNLIIRIIYLLICMTGNPIPVVFMYALVGLTCCTLGGTFNALVSEASDYTYYKTGERFDGSMYSCTSFGMKVGSGLGSAICLWLINAAGFNAAAAVQTTATNNMFIFNYGGVPVIVTAIILFIYFKLDVEKVNARTREENSLH